MDKKKNNGKYQAILKEWNGNLMKVCFGIIVAAFMVEIIFFAQYMITKTGKIVPESYILRYILLPTIVNLVLYYSCRALLKSKKFSEDAKRMLTLFLFTVLVSVIMIIHYTFEVLYAIIVIPLYASVVHAKKKVTKSTFLILIPVLMLDMVIIWFTKEEGIHNFIYNVVVTYIILILSYFLALSIVKFENQKEKLIMEQSAQNAKLQQELLYDGLTHIYNHTGMYSILEDYLIEKEDNAPIFLAVLDIDLFKLVNDDFGHETGNDVLVRLGELMQAISDNNVSVARYGGEEFCIMFRKLEKEDCYAILDELHKEFAEQKYAVINRKITFSAGLAGYEDGFTISALIEKADKCLYEAKNTGRNKIVMRE
jgi:diguanylate cyclase